MQTEFSQQFSSILAASTPFYFPLQSTAGVYVIKSLTCFSTQAFSAAPDSLSIVSATSSGGANLFYIDATSTGYAANTIVPIFTPTKQIILTQNYLGVLAKLDVYPGTVYVNVSYSFIPSTNANYNNFKIVKQTVTNTTSPLFSGQSTTQATIMKAITVVNSTGVSATVTPQITQNSITTPLSAATVIPEFSTYTLSPIIYLSSTQSISFVVTGTVEIIYSYTLDPNA